MPASAWQQPDPAGSPVKESQFRCSSNALPYAPPRHAALGADGARKPGAESGIVTGNAATDASARGWLVGHFTPRKSGRHADEVEVKWASRPAGEKRDAWSPATAARTLTILVAGGAFRVEVGEESVVLREPGDYVLFGPAQAHRWHALGAATMLTVRWPSGLGRS
ncbi:hypothetical protein AB0F91_43400 [Amycolatopsis sp. NPDC023774]|uniref:hypothetical protein n=1 Tax=Amycolatopsis sp. NPDC023774 TaxID=3155015 RepID=UPI0033CE081D